MRVWFYKRPPRTAGVGTALLGWLGRGRAFCVGIAVSQEARGARRLRLRGDAERSRPKPRCPIRITERRQARKGQSKATPVW